MIFWRLILSIFFLIGLGLLVGSYSAVQHTRHFLQTALPASGVVVENLYGKCHGTKNRNYNCYTPRIRFRTTDGYEIDFVSGESNPPIYAVNETVAVLYDPHDPYHAQIDSFGSLWGGVMLMVFLGVAFTTPGIGFFVWKIAQTRTRYATTRRVAQVP
jgi:hypothetical protein